jgi:tetratricopeptide (TPR) repeat protein
MTTDSIFNAIHDLLKDEKFNSAVRRLVQIGGTKLKSEFKHDANHAWYCVGDAEFKRGNYQIACAAFRRALKAEPTDVMCLLGVGNCYNEMKRPKLAERAFRNALALNTNGRLKASAEYNLANALYDQNQFDDALAIYKKVARRRDDIGELSRKNINLIKEATKK